uniref:Uncharacterized protein n=1 Tax=Arundo donax TaxID=35708 RepID=A0A0A9BYD4_ARUDO
MLVVSGLHIILSLKKTVPDVYQELVALLQLFVQGHHMCQTWFIGH